LEENQLILKHQKKSSVVRLKDFKCLEFTTFLLDVQH